MNHRQVIRQNDLGEPIRARALVYSDFGKSTLKAYDVVAKFTSATFKMVHSSGAPIIQGAAQLQPDGWLQYDPVGADTAVLGTYTATFKGTTAGGQTVTMPTEGSLTIEIVP